MPEEIKNKSGPQSFESKKLSDGSLMIKGWASRIERDDCGDVVLPEAFIPVLPRYMKKPIAAFNHDLNNPIGKTVVADVRANAGLWVEQILYPTTGKGADVIMLIEAGVINSFSFMFSTFGGITEWDDTTKTRTIKQFGQLYEIGPVAIGMNEEAIMQKLIEIKSINLKNIGGSRATVTGKDLEKMEPDEIKKELDTVKASLADLKNENAALIKLENELKDFKSRAERTADENDAFMKKFLPEYTKAMETMNEAIKEIGKRDMSMAQPLAAGFEMKEMIFAPEKEIKQTFSSDTAGRALYLRKLYDDILLIDAFKQKSRAGEAWSRAPFDARVKSLKTFGKFERLAKEFFGQSAVDAGLKAAMDFQQKAAFDTAGSNEGAEYLWTAYSGNLIELIRWDFDLLQMHERFYMPAASMYLPIEGADTIATRATQTTTKVSGPNTTTQTPGSDNALFTAEKLRGNTQWSREADEDLLVAAAEYIRRKVAKSITRALNKAYVSGDDAAATSYDSGDVPASTDCRYCWNGYRGISRHASFLNSTYLSDLSSFNETNLNKMLGNLGKYYSDCFIVMSIRGYLMHMLNPTEMPSVRTREKYGDAATVVTGELAQYQGKPIVQNEWILDTFDSAGVYSGSGKTRTSLIAVSRGAFMLGDRRLVTLEVVRDASNDVYDIYSYWRGDFKNIYPDTDVIVTEGINISTD